MSLQVRGDGAAELNTKDELSVQGALTVDKIIDCRECLYCCEYSPDKSKIAVGLEKGVIKIYNSAGDHLYSLVDVEVRQKYYPAMSVSWLGNERIIAGYAAGYIKVWNISNQQCLSTVEEGSPVYQVCVTPTQDMIITCGKGGELNLYNSTTLYKERTLMASPYPSKMDGHMSPIYCIKHHPVDTWNFLSGGWDNTVHFWDRREINSIKHLSGVHTCGKTIDIDHLTNTILTGSNRARPTSSDEHGLQLWDYREFTLMRSIPSTPEERCSYYSAQFLGSECVLAGGCNVNSLQIKRKRTGMNLASVSDLERGVFCIDKIENSETGRAKICYGSANNLNLASVEQINHKIAI